MSIRDSEIMDIPRKIMESFGVLHQNTTLVSNFLKFDEEGNVKGIQGKTEICNFVLRIIPSQAVRLI